MNFEMNFEVDFSFETSLETSLNFDFDEDYKPSFHQIVCDIRRDTSDQEQIKTFPFYFGNKCPYTDIDFIMNYQMTQEKIQEKIQEKTPKTIKKIKKIKKSKENKKSKKAQKSNKIMLRNIAPKLMSHGGVVRDMPNKHTHYIIATQVNVYS